MWYSCMYKAFLSLCLFLWMSMMRGVASFVRSFRASGSLIEFPVTTRVTSVSCVVIVRRHVQRFVVKPIAKLYNTIDNFVFQTYGYVAWNSPRYVAQVKTGFQRIRTIFRKYIWTERVLVEHKHLSPLHTGSTPWLSPINTGCDSAWIGWDAPTLPEEGNEWSFYIRGSGDKQGISITQSAWKGYQTYTQQLCLPPVDSPSRITVKDFEAYQTAIAMTGRMTSISDIHSSLSLLKGTSSSSDTPVSSFSSSNTLFPFSLSSMTTLSQSLEHFTPYSKLDLKDFNAEEEDISDVLFKTGTATPRLHPLSGALEDLEGTKYSSINIIARKGDFNPRSINSFGDIEALFANSFGAPVSRVDELSARPSARPVVRHSVITSPSIYSQDSAGSEEAFLVDTPHPDADYRNFLVECGYEDNVCSDDTVSVTASGACGRDYIITPLSADIVPFEEGLGDSNVSLFGTFSASEDSSLLEENISNLTLAEASIRWSNLCPAETVFSKEQRRIFLIKDDDSLSQFSGISSPRDPVFSEDVCTDVPQLDISDNNVSCISLESDNTSVSFSVIPSLLGNSLTSIVSDEVRPVRYTVGSTPGHVGGARSYRVDFRGTPLRTVRPVDGPEYLDLQAVQEQQQTESEPHSRSAVKLHPYPPVKSHVRQNISTSKWTSPEFASASAPTTPGVSDASLSALEYIERRRVRLSYFLQRDYQREYNHPSLFSPSLSVSRTSDSPSPRCQIRQGVPF